MIDSVCSSKVLENGLGLVKNVLVFNSKYAQNYESARNLAIGMIKRNSITLDELHDIDFVAYTVRGVSDIDISSNRRHCEGAKQPK